MILSYRHLISRLWSLTADAQIVALYEALIANPDDDLCVPEKLWAVVQQLEDMFPVHTDMVYEETHHYQGEMPDVPFNHVVCLQGADCEMQWEDWHDVVKLMIALGQAGPAAQESPYFSPYPDDIPIWWQQMATRYRLPPLAEIDRKGMLVRLESLPEPWNGLYAIWRWLDADTGNLFVDIPCAYCTEMDMTDLDWNVETVRRLEQEWQWAEREIFGPMNRLQDLLARDPAALGTCFDLILGRQSLALPVPTAPRPLVEILAEEEAT